MGVVCILRRDPLLVSCDDCSDYHCSECHGTHSCSECWDEGIFRYFPHDAGYDPKCEDHQ